MLKRGPKSGDFGKLIADRFPHFVFNLIYNTFEDMKPSYMKHFLLIAALCFSVNVINAQILRNLANKAINAGINEAANAALKNTTLNIGDLSLNFQKDKEQLYNSDVWKVYLKGEELISVYRNVDLQKTAGQVYRAKDYSFDLFIVNDTIVVIGSNVTRKPYNEDYKNGPKFEVLIISDSIIYKGIYSGNSLADQLPVKGKNNFDRELFKPYIKFSKGKIYDLNKTSKKDTSNLLGTYKYYSPGKANFICAAILYKTQYKNMAKLLDDEAEQNIIQYAQDWNAKEKSCDHCSATFKGSAITLGSRSDCSTDVEQSGLWLKPGTPLFCSKKCAEKYCIDLKR